MFERNTGTINGITLTQSGSQFAKTLVSRPDVIIGGVATLAPRSLPPVASAGQRRTANSSGLRAGRLGGSPAETMTTKDGTRIHFRDCGPGQPIVFYHGWPLNADAWDAQMLFLAQHGYRVIAHDRRGHGCSGQSRGRNNLNTYADDLAPLMDVLDLKSFMFVGGSTSAGEVVRYTFTLPWTMPVALCRCRW